jgi:hypothetical protein
MSRARTSLHLDPQAFARGAITASKRHLVSSVLLTVAVGVAAALLHYATAMIAAGMIGFFLVVYNVLRIRAASRALGSAELGVKFVERQRRSHLVRGTAYLFLSPVLVLVTAIGLALEKPGPPAIEWLLFGAIWALLAYYWVWWLRALRRVRLWSTADDRGAS